MSAPRLCKYNCSKELYWDQAKKIFLELDGTEHTKARCESLQTPKPAPATANLTSEQQRAADIQRLHNENIEASKLLTQSINRLAAALEARKI